MCLSISVIISLLWKKYNKVYDVKLKECGRKNVDYYNEKKICLEHVTMTTLNATPQQTHMYIDGMMWNKSILLWAKKYINKPIE